MRKLKTPLSIFAGALIGLLTGWVFTRSFAGEPLAYLAPPFGVVTGVLCSYAYRHLLDTVVDQPSQQPLVVSICLLIFGALIFGGPLGFLCALGSALFTFTLAAYCMRDLYRGDWRLAVRDLWRIARSRLAGAQIIEDGQSVYPRGEQSPVGPRELTIQPYNAVVLERGNRQTRISGPARLTTMKAEAVKRIYDLRPKQESLSFKNVLTRDLIPASITIAATYRIDVSEAGARGQASFQPEDRQTIQRLDLRMRDWEKGARAAIEESVRAVLARLNLQALQQQQNARLLERQIRSRANRSTNAWGIVIDKVLLENVQLEHEVTAAATGDWVTTRKGRAVATVDLARANAWASALTALAGAYKSASKAGLKPDAIDWEAWRRTLEQVAKDIQVNLS